MEEACLMGFSEGFEQEKPASAFPDLKKIPINKIYTGQSKR